MPAGVSLMTLTEAQDTVQRSQPLESSFVQCARPKREGRGSSARNVVRSPVFSFSPCCALLYARRRRSVTLAMRTPDE